MNRGLLGIAEEINTQEQYTFTVMCKNSAICTISGTNKDLEDMLVISKLNPTVIPYSNLLYVLRHRFSFFNRMEARDVLKSIGISSKIDLLRLTHGVSVSDCYWVKFENENLTWDDVNPYVGDHKFDISWFMEKDNPFYKLVLPNYSTDGIFPKCWITENGFHYLIKAGTQGAFNAGLEPVSEALFVQIAKALGYDNVVDYDITTVKYPPQVKYSIPTLVKNCTTISDGRLATKCKAFTTENISLVTARDLGFKTYDECLTFAEECTCNSIDLALMLLCDCIGMNEDRHMGNIGFLYNPDTNVLNKVAPMYDNNLSLLCYYDDRDDLDEYVSQLRPKDGGTFQELYITLLKRYPVLQVYIKNLKKNIIGGKLLKSDILKSSRLDLLNKVVFKNIQTVS